MHQAYRALLARIESRLPAHPELHPLWRDVEALDDLDPLRIPALKAMKRVPAPPVELLYRREGDALALGARNVVRKREAKVPTHCTTLPCPAWLWSADAPAPPALAPDLRRDCAELVCASFELFATRVGNHFTVRWARRLVVAPGPLAVLDFSEPVPGTPAGA